MRFCCILYLWAYERICRVCIQKWLISEQILLYFGSVSGVKGFLLPLSPLTSGTESSRQNYEHGYLIILSDNEVDC
jgi:hypothetical protein